MLKQFLRNLLFGFTLLALTASVAYACYRGCNCRNTYSSISYGFTPYYTYFPRYVHNRYYKRYYPRYRYRHRVAYYRYSRYRYAPRYRYRHRVVYRSAPRYRYKYRRANYRHRGRVAHRRGRR